MWRLIRAVRVIDGVELPWLITRFREVVCWSCKHILGMIFVIMLVLVSFVIYLFLVFEFCYYCINY